MAHEEKLPWELTEEILSRVPPKSLVRFRTVSKKWNALFDDKIFIHNHKTTFQFILATKSKIYLVSITPKMEVRELPLDIPGLESEALKNLVDYNEFLLLGMDKRAVVWNPWLRQTRWIHEDHDQLSLHFNGIGYAYDDSKPDEERSYKILASYTKESELKKCWKIYDFASDSWKEKEVDSKNSSSSNEGQNRIAILTEGGVSLNGVLYWVSYYVKTSLYVLICFNSSVEKFFLLCNLPCGEKYQDGDAFALRVYRGDWFSLLKQCHLTKKIEVWVTKNKVNMSCNQDMEWMVFMEVSIPNLPALIQIGSNSQPSYFIDDKNLVVCSCDEIGRAWIYVLGNNTLISKTRIDSVVDPWPLHCTYFPSLVPVPQGQREEAELQV